jgi:hypothetical protein
MGKRGMIATVDNPADTLDAILPTQTSNSGKALVTNGTTHSWGSAAGLVPIGAIVAWHKAFTNTPALPAQFVECNGQVLSDAASVYNGQTIPNLNAVDGTGRFLRGDATSGTLANYSTALPTSAFTSGNASQTHTHTTTIGNKTSGTESATHTHNQATKAQTISVAGGGTDGTWSLETTAATGTESATHTHTTDVGSPVSGTESQSHTHTITGGGDAQTAPYSFTVVWIMRIK